MTNLPVIRKIVVSSVASIVVLMYILFVPPAGPAVIGGLIALVTLSLYIIVAMWATRKLATLAAFGIALFLGMNAIIGFEIVNTILLASFIIGTALLIK